MIVVLNATLHHPSIISVLPDYVFRHYQYLRTKEHDLTPDLHNQLTGSIDLDVSLPPAISLSSHDVFERILKLSEQGLDLIANERQKFYRNLATYVVFLIHRTQLNKTFFNSVNYINSPKWISIFLPYPNVSRSITKS